MTRPPALARRLLEARLPEAVRPFFLGDLEERYQTYARRSRLRADLWFWRQAIAAVFAPLPGPAGVERPSALGDLRTDLLSALRSLSRRPAPALAAIATLGLGIGVSATAFSVLYGTILRGLPFEEAERLVHFERANLPAGQNSLAVTPHDYLAWVESQTSFEGLGAFVETATTIPSEGASPEPLTGVRISANSFDLLRVAPLHGRVFSEADEAPGAPDVVVLSHGVWSARFGSDPSLVGRTIRLDDGAATVIGVMPPRFGFPIAEEYWEPLRIDRSAIVRGEGRLDVFGRLLPGVSLEQAQGEFQGITGRLAEAFPETNRDISASLRTFHDEYVGEDFTRTTVRMLCAALLLLALCCANVANLLLVGGSRRRGDLALRVSLGATRGRIVRQLMTETSLLAAGGALLGAGLAWYGVAWFDRAGAQAGVFDLPHGSDSLFWWDVGLDAPTLLFLVGVTVLAALLAGLAPALGLSDAAAGGTLTVRSGVGGRRRAGMAADGLVVAQLALTTGLLVAAGLVVRSSLNLDSAGAVLEGDDVIVAGLSLTSNHHADDAARLAWVEEAIDRLTSGPAARTAALGTRLPMTLPHSVAFSTGLVEAAEARPEAGVVSVTPDYFRAFGVSLEAGRFFDDSDRSGSERVAIVNRSFAERYLVNGSGGIRSSTGGAVDLSSVPGTRIRLDAEGEEWLTVVGVVPDLWRRPLQPEREAGIYLPLAQSASGNGPARLGRLGLRYPQIVLLGRGDGAATAAALRSGVHAQDPTVPFRSIRSMDEVLTQQLGRYRVWGRFYLGFAIAGTLLAILGVYSVLSFRVAQRSAEIGVRRALGASTSAVRRVVMGTAGAQVLAGGVAGLALGWLLAGGLAGILFGVETRDPLVFFSVAALVALVGLLASWLPARRASRIDPVEAIRVQS